MKKFNEKKYWLKDNYVKECVSNKKVVSNLILKIGEDLLNKMMLEKYSKMVRDGI